MTAYKESLCSSAKDQSALKGQYKGGLLLLYNVIMVLLVSASAAVCFIFEMENMMMSPSTQMKQHAELELFRIFFQ